MQIVKRLSDALPSERQLADIELQLGGKLPTDFREFLAATNGGKPLPSVFLVRTTDGESDSRVRYFLTLDSAASSYSIQEFRRRYADRIPNGVLPIACDSFGNVVLLDICANKPGAVYFWDHENEAMGEPTWNNISVVAATFTEFVSLLE